MRAEVEDLIAGFNDAGLEPVVFRGAEWLMGHYAPHARRLISDLDLWFPDSTEQEAALRVLAELGYRPLTPIEEHDKSRSHHFPPFHRKGAVARLELHHRLIRSTLAASMDLEGAAARLRPTDCNGLRYRRLDPGDALTVAFLQSGRMAIPGFETRKVAVSKWLDFLDRFVLAGRSAISHPADIGITDGVHPTDIQLLTALKEKFDLPTAGCATRPISRPGRRREWSRTRSSNPSGARSRGRTSVRRRHGTGSRRISRTVCARCE